MWSRRYRHGVLGRRPWYRYFANCIALPNQVYRATVQVVNPNTVQLTGWSEHYFHDNPLLNLQSDEEWMISNIDCEVNLNASLALAMSQGQAIVVSDGSFYQSYQAGGAGWYIETIDRSYLTWSNCIAPGAATAQSSPRSELTGILGSIMHCNYICSRFGIQDGKITLFCDNEGSIKSLRSLHTIIKNSRRNFDMFQSIRRAVNYSPLQWNFEYVPGHQDECYDFEALSRPAQLNVLADLKAKEVVLEAVENNSLDAFRLHSLPYMTSEVRVVDMEGKIQPIHSHLQKSIKHHCSTVNIRKYWIKKHQLETMTSKLDWELKTKSHTNSSKSINRWLSKHSTGFCGVGKMLVRYKYQTHSTCPRCGQTQESTSHVLQCKDETACSLWDSELAKLQSWMIKQKVQPDLAKQLVLYLNAWKYRTPKPRVLPANSLLRKAILHQDRIGWKQFIEGFWARSWRDSQTAYFASINSPNSSMLLLSKVQRRIWHIAWEMWSQRNDHLHGDSSSTPVVEQRAINTEIATEWETGAAMLPVRHQHLFQGTLQQCLQKSYHNKRTWLASVWSAREMIDVNYLANNPSTTDATCRLRYIQWKTSRHRPPT